MTRPQQKTPLSQHSSLLKAKVFSAQETSPPSKSQPSSPLHSAVDSTPKTSPSSPLPTNVKSDHEPKQLIMQGLQRQQPLRTAWPAETDFCFVKTLAEHTTCDGTNGLGLNHTYMDQAAIQLVEDSLSHSVDIATIADECRHRFPNKNEAHYSVESIELLLELSRKCPGYSFQQLNTKHLNMWTRVIAPFRQVFETGTLYKSKQLFHRDCKKFAKVFINFFTFIVQQGIEANYCPTLVKNAGQASKLLEQWIVSMFEHHGVNMSQFMFQCGLHLCRAYVRNKQTVYPTASEHAILTSQSPAASDILTVLKNYFGYICEYEDVTPAAKFEMDSRNMQTNKPLLNKVSVDPRYIQQMVTVAHPRAVQYPSQTPYTRPAVCQPSRPSVVNAHSSDRPYPTAYPVQATYPHPTGPWQDGMSRPAPSHPHIVQRPSAAPLRPTPVYPAPAYSNPNRSPPYSPTHNIYLHREQGEHGANGNPLPAVSPRMRVHQQSSQGNWAHPPEYSRPVAPPHVGQATSPKYTSRYPAAFPSVASTTRANGPSDRQAAPVRLAPILENRRVNGGQAVDKLINDTLDQLDSSDAEYKAETSEETTAVQSPATLDRQPFP
ncbi:hypothetical protein GGI16_001295, partial [Coemansia sp. S142-1]